MSDKVKVQEFKVRKLVREVLDGKVSPDALTEAKPEKGEKGEEGESEESKTKKLRTFRRPMPTAKEKHGVTPLEKRFQFSRGKSGYRLGGSLATTYLASDPSLPSEEEVASRSGVKGYYGVDVDPKTGEWAPGEEFELIRSLKGAPGARLDIERALDKIRLSNPPERGGVPEMVDDMIDHIIDIYKRELARSMQKAKTAIRLYKQEMIETGELDPEDVEYLRRDPRADAAIWELPAFQKYVAEELKLDRRHISTLNKLAHTGFLSLDRPDATTDVDEILYNDPGFRTFLGRTKYWDWVRNAAEELPDVPGAKTGRYRGQF